MRPRWGHLALEDRLLQMLAEATHRLVDLRVASPSTKRRDETLKRHLYERYGVDEYWLVDPANETIIVLRLQDGSYAEAERLSLAAGAVLTTPLLPGLELALRDVFAE